MGMDDQLCANSSILGNEFYYAYKYAGHSPGLVLMAILIASCAIPGNILNIFLVYLTIRHKSLRGTSNYLLAQHSLFEFLHQTGHYIFLFTIFSGRNFIPFMTSAAFQMQSIFGYNAAIFTMIETAIDRFLSVVLPNIHSKLDGSVHLGIYTLLACIPGIYLSYLVMDYAIAHPNEPVTGQLSDTCSPVDLIYKYNMAICVFCFFFYIFIGALVFKKSQSARNSRLFKSLAAIIVIMVGGYFLNTIIRVLVSDMLHLGPIKLWFVNVLGGVMVNIGAAANTPILYVFSTDYRKIINHELNLLFGWTNWPNQQNTHASPPAIFTLPPTAPFNNTNSFSKSLGPFSRVHPAPLGRGRVISTII